MKIEEKIRKEEDKEEGEEEEEESVEVACGMSNKVLRIIRDIGQTSLSIIRSFGRSAGPGPSVSRCWFRRKIVAFPARIAIILGIMYDRIVLTCLFHALSFYQVNEISWICVIIVLHSSLTLQRVVSSP